MTLLNLKYFVDADINYGYYCQYLNPSTVRSALYANKMVQVYDIVKKELKNSDLKQKHRNILRDLLLGGVVYVRRMDPIQTKFVRLVDVISCVLSHKAQSKQFDPLYKGMRRCSEWSWMWDKSTYISNPIKIFEFSVTRNNGITTTDMELTTRFNVTWSDVEVVYLAFMSKTNKAKYKRETLKLLKTRDNEIETVY